MALSDTIAVIIAFIVLTLTCVPFIKWYKKRSRFVNLMNAIPGPKSYPLIGTTYLIFGVDRKDLIGLSNDLHTRYPDLLRTWLGPVAQVELKKAEHIEKVLSSSKHHLQKSWGYKFVKLWLGDGLLIANGDKWHSHRKIITPTFHFTILESFCEIFAEKSNILIEKLNKHCDTGVPVDIYPFITKAALDIISDAAMGVQINAQDQSENEYISAIYEIVEMLLRRILRPWLHPEILYRYSAEGKKFARTLNTLHNFTKDVIKQRRAHRQKITNDKDTTTGKKKRLAFLDFLLETSEQGHEYLNDDDICAEVDTFMFEGHDTTTAGIAWTLFLLGQHPQIQEEAFAELEAIFRGTKRHATIHDFNEMKCLDRIIKESLRLYPSVPAIGRTLSEDIELEGYTVPSGCDVSIEIYLLHRDERFFPDPEKFDPNRFLPENTVNRHPYAYIPFSAGPRNCIGQKFAMYEEKSMLSSIIRNFRLKAVGSRSDIDMVKELILRPIRGLPIIFEKR